MYIIGCSIFLMTSKVCKGYKKKAPKKQPILFVALNPKSVFTFGKVWNIIKTAIACFGIEQATRYL